MDGDRSRVAYLTDHYPATSHTFVQREVAALRDLGVEVHTFSTHRVGPEHVLSEDDRTAFESTFAILPISPGRLAATHLRAVVAEPGAYFRTGALTLRLGRRMRDRLWQLFYFAEAVVLWGQCRARGITHVHAHFTRPAADAALLASHLGALADPAAGWTWSFSAHGADIYDTDPSALAAKIRHATTVICVSEYGREWLSQLVGEPHHAKIEIARCGIDLDRYRAVARRRDPSQPLRILTVGRLVPVKGHMVLIHAIARLVSRGVDAELTIVGDGPLREELEKVARQHAIADRVHFAGRVGQDDILPFYERADVFALASLAEGVPVVLMEAMATGLPVVASRIAGIPELVDDGRHGLLVTAGRDAEVADALATLADDPDRRAAMGRAGRQRIEEEFELRATAVRLHEILEQYGALAARSDGRRSGVRATTAASSEASGSRGGGQESSR